MNWKEPALFGLIANLGHLQEIQHRDCAPHLRAGHFGDGALKAPVVCEVAATYKESACV